MPGKSPGGEAPREIPKRLSAHRVRQVWIKPDKRQEDELALAHSRVRYDEVGRGDYRGPVEKDIDIHRSRALRHDRRTIAAQRRLDGIDRGEQLARAQAGAPRGDCVEEIGLILDVPRLGAPEPGDAEIAY